MLLYNRFHFKAMVYNWLPIEDQAILDARREVDHLEAISVAYPEVLKDEVFLKPDPLNWNELRQLANVSEVQSYSMVMDEIIS